MKIIIGFFIFFLVLFIYLHILYHLKTSNDLEIYKIDNPSKEKLEEVFDLRQPVLFDFENQEIIKITNKNYIHKHLNNFDIKIRNVNDDPDISNNGLFVSLQLNTAIKLFSEDKQFSYFSENNFDFLKDTLLLKTISYNDKLLRPPMVSNCNYDIMMGSTGTKTPFRYEINHRNFFLLTQGSAQIKLSPPNNSKYFYPNYDYENFEFRSPIDPWQPQAKYSIDFNKSKCIDVILTPGKTIFIPPYWWYSIQFNENTSITCFYYKTYMSNLSILPYICLNILQNQNIKHISQNSITTVY